MLRDTELVAPSALGKYDPHMKLWHPLESVLGKCEPPYAKLAMGLITVTFIKTTTTQGPQRHFLNIYINATEKQVACIV